jgi:hypothetical protein
VRASLGLVHRFVALCNVVEQVRQWRNRRRWAASRVVAEAFALGYGEGFKAGETWGVTKAGQGHRLRLAYRATPGGVVRPFTADELRAFAGGNPTPETWPANWEQRRN